MALTACPRAAMVPVPDHGPNPNRRQGSPGMRPWGTLGAGLLAGLLAACIPSQVKPSSWFKGHNPLQAPPAANTVQMELALLECPIGDPYINRDLWTLADEQIVSPESKAALADNGFRVAQVGGIIPAELQT